MVSWTAALELLMKHVIKDLQCRGENVKLILCSFNGDS